MNWWQIQAWLTPKYCSIDYKCLISQQTVSSYVSFISIIFKVFSEVLCVSVLSIQNSLSEGYLNLLIIHQYHSWVLLYLWFWGEIISSFCCRHTW